ncbi:hypothetical protein PR048_024452 [Dryococelus australis]|uniref:Uncharacterized protein n=1 Tax=Dryococelus australis TaxID=614101 RepID=A0ABQ9GNL4_9NEOP|nr:hypothetical protein PR048_024452 [Dryococelus australis]
MVAGLSSQFCTSLEEGSCPHWDSNPQGLGAVEARQEHRDVTMLRGRGREVVRLLASHQSEPGSIPSRVDLGFSHVGIVPDDAAGRRVFSGISRSGSTFIPALHRTYIDSPSSALKTSMLRTAKISSLIYLLEMIELREEIYKLGKTKSTLQQIKLEKTHQPAASSGTIPTCENPGLTQPGTEPCSSRWEVSSLTAQSPRLPKMSELRSLTSRLVTNLPTGSPAVRENLVRRSNQSDTRPVSRESHDQSVNGYAYIKRTATTLCFGCARNVQFGDGWGVGWLDPRPHSPITAGRIKPTTLPAPSSSSTGAAEAERIDCSPPAKAKPGSIPGRATPGLSRMGIGPDDAAGRRVFSADLPFPPPSYSGSAPFSPSLALKTSLLRAAQISQLYFSSTELRLITKSTEVEQSLIKRIPATHARKTASLASSKLRRNVLANQPARINLPGYRPTYREHPITATGNYSPPTKANRLRFPAGVVPGFTHAGIVLDDAPGRRSPVTPPPPPLSSGAAPYSPRFTLIGSRYLDVKSRLYTLERLLLKKKNLHLERLLVKDDSPIAVFCAKTGVGRTMNAVYNCQRTSLWLVIDQSMTVPVGDAVAEVRREHGTLVPSPTRRDDGTLHGRDSVALIAPAILGFKGGETSQSRQVGAVQCSVVQVQLHQNPLCKCANRMRARAFAQYIRPGFGIVDELLNKLIEHSSSGEDDD